ncbi:hypothetical protein B0T17DRAFT_160373 [Bombardia bombarda]|uniref:Nitrogen regulatory protein areA GATA-like domain-containing protein n=1 Tax=Bombardia bombarda TaxID=252184 RepID=A0AA39X811_9PEZI|nr:hypothetical protein B0T17DRAFT_160373 [Bombardia bombarda]
MAMLLPKGFVENTREIYAEVASYPVVPPEKIWQYWNVYTTTFRRLVDPTAYRLENFWWHVWGSDRRQLSGPALARLFEEFSSGPTFVPLRGPSNRYEGPPIPSPSQRALERLNAQYLQHVDQGQQQQSQQQSSSPKSNVKSPTPSSSRPPPPHPILKKSRGPSASGPRPTARFVLPPPSDEEDAKDGSEASPSSTVVAMSDMQPPPLPPTTKLEKPAAPAAPPTRVEMPPPPVPLSVKRQAPAASLAASSASLSKTLVEPPSVPLKPGTVTASPVAAPGAKSRPPPAVSPGKGEKNSTPIKTIVASTAASRRRAVLPRRQSSQSSAGSDASSRETSASAIAERRTGNHRAAPRSVVEQPGQSSQESSGSSSQASVLMMMSSKAAGKQPAKPSSKRSTPRGSPAQTDGHQDCLVVVHHAHGILPQRRSTWDARGSQAAQKLTEHRNGALTGAVPVAGFVTDLAGAGSVAPRMARSRSNINTATQPLVGISIVATSNTTAEGQFDSDLSSPGSKIHQEAHDIPDNVMLPSRLSSSSLLEMSFTPTPSNPAPRIPFGRSRSQLKILLEREKAWKS